MNLCLYVWLTAKYGVEQNMDPVEEHVKKTIVTAARETWEIYFSRLFPASVRVGGIHRDCNCLVCYSSF